MGLWAEAFPDHACYALSENSLCLKGKPELASWSLSDHVEENLVHPGAAYG